MINSKIELKSFGENSSSDGFMKHSESKRKLSSRSSMQKAGLIRKDTNNSMSDNDGSCNSFRSGNSDTVIQRVAGDGQNKNN